MSYPSAPRGVYQIDVVNQVGSAYRTVFGRLQLVGELALLPYLIVLAAEFVAFLLPDRGTIAAVLAALIRAVGFLLFGTVFIVRWHRYVLLDESVSVGLIPPGWKHFVIAGIKLTVIVFVGWLALAMLALLPPRFVTIPLSAIGGVALTLLALRVSLIFPAAAIERPIGLQTAWEWIEGNFWRLFACAFACYLPFAALQILVGVLQTRSTALTSIVFDALRLAISFAASAVIGALLSHIYRDIAPDIRRI